ncbi:hypothetical protein ACH5RR_001390 [Cinchona calisaya]|uniref:Protein FAR1-RELATED SEQUENCE n=1 Tax=Cinchona calisaya TaxID=153742 RepID=A0ABD3B4H8_9GENT
MVLVSALAKLRVLKMMLAIGEFPDVNVLNSFDEDDILNMTFKAKAEAGEFYNFYAKAMGFSSRKSNKQFDDNRKTQYRLGFVLMKAIGFPCVHMFRAMNLEEMTKIPNSYILHRWKRQYKKTRLVNDNLCEGLDAKVICSMAKFSSLVAICKQMCYPERREAQQPTTCEVDATESDVDLEEDKDMNLSNTEFTHFSVIRDWCDFGTNHDSSELLLFRQLLPNNQLGRLTIVAIFTSEACIDCYLAALGVAVVAFFSI